jgi:hypothetical protein
MANKKEVDTARDIGQSEVSMLGIYLVVEADAQPDRRSRGGFPGDSPRRVRLGGRQELCGQ